LTKKKDGAKILAQQVIKMNDELNSRTGKYAATCRGVSQKKDPQEDIYLNKEKKTMKGQKNLSRRERQIMDIIYELEEATAARVLEHLPSPPSYSTVRALLRVLEEKGHLKHKQDGPRYVFLPTLPREEARENALKHVLKTFFDNSTEKVMAALLDISEEELSEADFERLNELIKKARQEGR
jgi:predicted transcriptional regulator